MFSCFGAFRGGFGLMPFHGLFWLLIIGGLVFLFMRHRNHTSNYAMSDSNVIGILEERYAKGEISKEEFLEKRSAILKGK